MATVTEQFAENLAVASVKRVYGIVGDSLNGITDAIRKQDKIQWLHVRHEEVAAFAAGAEAHLTGSLTVCAGSCGPGNLHLINGLFDCHRSRVPVLAIAAHSRPRRPPGCRPGGESPLPRPLAQAQNSVGRSLRRRRQAPNRRRRALSQRPAAWPR